MKSNQIKLCVFDLAGTLVVDHNYVRKYFIKAFHEADLHLDADLVDGQMGVEKKKAILTLLNHFPQLKGKQTLANKIHTSFNEGMIDYYTHHAKPMPFANTTITKLKEHGYKIAVNTGFGKKIMKTILHTLRWNDVMDVAISADQVLAGRPAPDMIEYIMKKTKINDPGQIAKIGDTPVDLKEGHNAKCALNIGIAKDQIKANELLSYPHTHVVPNLRTALEIILNY